MLLPCTLTPSMHTAGFAAQAHNAIALQDGWQGMCSRQSCSVWTLGKGWEINTAEALRTLQSASATIQGYFLGAWMYLGIIFTLPLGLGVFALALDLPISNDEALQGLVMPASAYVLLGKGGKQTSVLPD